MSLKIIYTIIGALIALLPAYFGDLRVWETFLVGVPLAALLTIGGIMFVSFITNFRAEESGREYKVIPFKNPAIFAAVGATVALIAFAIWH